MRISKRSILVVATMAVLIFVAVGLARNEFWDLFSPSLTLPTQDVVWMGSRDRSLVVGYDRKNDKFAALELSRENSRLFVLPTGVLLTRIFDDKRGEFGTSRINCQTLSLENNRVILSKRRTIIREIPGFVWNVVGAPDDRIYLASNRELKDEESFIGRNYVYIGSWQGNVDVHLNSQLPDELLDEFQFARYYEGVDIQYLDQTREMVLIGSNGAPNRFVGASNSSAFEGPYQPKSQLFTDSRLDRIATIKAYKSAWRLNVWRITSGLKLKELVFDDGFERVARSTAGGAFLFENDCLTYFDRQVVWWRLDSPEDSCAQSLEIEMPDDMQIDSMHRFESNGVLAIGYVDTNSSNNFTRNYYLCRIDLGPDRKLKIGPWELAETTAQ